VLRLLLAVALALTACGKDRPRDDYGTVPPFSLRDQTDQPLTEAWLRGHLTVIDFIFTRCDSICTDLSYRMSYLDEQTRDLGDKVKLLSFSVDPEHDTPAVLAEYGARFGADPARWRLVTGDYPQVTALVTGALMTAMTDMGTTTETGAPDIRHGGHFLLVDGDLKIVGIYDSSEQSRLEALVGDIRRRAK
jgi:protein SCO1/2